MYVRVCYYDLLRPAEGCHFVRRHVALNRSRSRLAGHSAVLMLQDPKNRQYLGRQQVCMVDDSRTV